NVKVLRGIGSGCDEEAVRVVSSMPKWKPGIQNGEAVRVSYNIPIKFALH
ncbi:MAG: energy transducer TonB, partial [Bacteroidetes bacterium CG_4_9_14_3_um_filter_41_19]